MANGSIKCYINIFSITEEKETEDTMAFISYNIKPDIKTLSNQQIIRGTSSPYIFNYVNLYIQHLSRLQNTRRIQKPPKLKNNSYLK